jgi:hypothetical protein
MAAKLLTRKNAVGQYIISAMVGMAGFAYFTQIIAPCN